MAAAPCTRLPAGARVGFELIEHALAGGCAGVDRLLCGLGPGIGMLAGIVIGAAAVSGLNAQGKGPGAYAIVDISEITDPATFKTLLPIAGKANDQFGGKFIARTENVVALDGTAPKRFVVIAFDSMDKAKAWDKSPLPDEVNAIRKKSTKSRTYLVDGELQ
jgi:uncharacterized protein (DUF1330 family)